MSLLEEDKTYWVHPDPNLLYRHYRLLRARVRRLLRMVVCLTCPETSTATQAPRQRLLMRYVKLPVVRDKKLSIL